MELTKEEAKFIYDVINFIQIDSFRRLGDHLKLLAKIDAKDNGDRMNTWIEESTKEFDKTQTIKTKMLDIIDGGGKQE